MSNFDLRKFLTENKLTDTSKYLNEEKSQKEWGKELEKEVKKKYGSKFEVTAEYTGQGFKLAIYNKGGDVQVSANSAYINDPKKNPDKFNVFVYDESDRDILVNKKNLDMDSALREIKGFVRKYLK